MKAAHRVVAYGSIASVWPPVTSDLPPANGHRQTGPAGPVRAKWRTLQPIRSPQRPPNQSGCILHDLKPLSLQFEYTAMAKCAHSFGLIQSWLLHSGSSFLWVTERPSEWRTRSHPWDHPTFNLPLSDALRFSFSVAL